jgi:hypothetical protein
MPTRSLSSPYHYIAIHVAPPTEQLALRYAIQKALQQLFGVTRAGTAVDVLNEEVEIVGGQEQGLIILRVAAEWVYQLLICPTGIFVIRMIGTQSLCSPRSPHGRTLR